VTRLVLATHNPHKVVELRRILADAALGHVEIVGVDAFPGLPDVAETGVTFAENALLKAHAVAAATGLPAVGDDSGLCVDVLGGSPGVFSARWSGRHGDDLANLELLLAQLSDVPDDRRGAHFACAAALALPAGDERVAAVRDGVSTLAELLSRTDGWSPPNLSGIEVVAQPHCHHASVLGWATDAALLNASGATVTTVGGCCGLAGNFGVEQGHYEVSVKIAEHDLLPAAAAHPDAVVLADGFSCRTQLAELAGREAVTLAELLLVQAPAATTRGTARRSPARSTARP